MTSVSYARGDFTSSLPEAVEMAAKRGAIDDLMERVAALEMARAPAGAGAPAPASPAELCHFQKQPGGCSRGDACGLAATHVPKA